MLLELTEEEYEWKIQVLKIITKFSNINDEKVNSYKNKTSRKFREIISQGEDKTLLALVNANQQLLRCLPPIKNKDKFLKYNESNHGFKYSSKFHYLNAYYKEE